MKLVIFFWGLYLGIILGHMSAEKKMRKILKQSNVKIAQALKLERE